MRATREDSGWKTDEPTPTIPAATRSAEKLPALDRSNSPTRVKPIPTASENGMGRRSV